MRLIFGLILTFSLCAAERIERWGVFEVALTGPASGNFSGKFTMKLPGKPFLEMRFEVPAK